MPPSAAPSSAPGGPPTTPPIAAPVAAPVAAPTPVPTGCEPGSPVRGSRLASCRSARSASRVVVPVVPVVVFHCRPCRSPCSRFLGLSVDVVDTPRPLQGGCQRPASRSATMAGMPAAPALPTPPFADRPGGARPGPSSAGPERVARCLRGPPRRGRRPARRGLFPRGIDFDLPLHLEGAAEGEVRPCRPPNCSCGPPLPAGRWSPRHRRPSAHCRCPARRPGPALERGRRRPRPASLLIPVPRLSAEPRPFSGRRSPGPPDDLTGRPGRPGT